jgi:hypothetical protein
MDILLSPEKLSDWLLARWALLRINALREPLPHKAAALEAAFEPQVLRRFLGREEVEALLMLFRILSPGVFAPLVEELAQAWPEQPRTLAWRMAETLAVVAPERLAGLLEAWVAEHPLGSALPSLTGYARALLALPPGPGRALAQGLVEFVRSSRDVHLLDLLRPELIELALRHELPEIHALVAGLFEAEHANRYLHDDALLHSSHALTGGLPYFELLERRARGETEQRLEPLAPLFLPEAPLGELDALLERPPHEALVRLGGLLPQGGGAPAETLRGLLDQDWSGRSEEELQQLVLFGIGLAAAAWSRPGPDWSSLTAGSIAALAAADLVRLPDREGALERLRALPRPSVVEALEAALLENEESAGAATLAGLLGELGDPEAIRPLRAALDSSINQALVDTAAEALCRFGEAAEQALVPRWEDLTEAQQDYGSWILSLVGGGPSVRLLLSRRSDLQDKETVPLWTAMALGLPDPRLLDALEEERRTNQRIEVQEAYLMQRLLLERDGPDLEPIRERVLLRTFEQDSSELGEGWDEEELPDRGPPLVAELRCVRCGVVADYESPKIYVDFDAPESGPLPDGVVVCQSCDRAESLELTERGLAAVAERARQAVELGTSADSLEELPVQLEDGRRVPVSAAVAHYRRAIAERPQSAVDLFMLGRCWKRSGYGSRAMGTYRECLAAEPGYVQASFDLASLLESNDFDSPAMDVLEEAMQHRRRWRLFRVIEFATMADLNRAFAELYNRLREKLGDPQRPRLTGVALATQKAGRNDPCPCGSGKKYKKCCLLKNQ